eukprot:CFRG7186T1
MVQLNTILLALAAGFCCSGYSVSGYGIPDKSTTLGIRTLILGTYNGTVVLPKNIVTAYGAPFDVFVGEMPDLEDENVNKWHSVVVADADVPVETVRKYASRTYARVVFLHSLENVDDIDTLGVQPVIIDGLCPNVTIADSDNARLLAGAVNSHSSWNISETSPTAVVISDPTRTTSFIAYESVTSSERTGNNSTADEPNVITAAFVSNTSWQTEEMHFRFSANMVSLSPNFKPYYEIATEYTQTNLGLGHAWFEWITRGVFLGYRRLSLNLHVDDWFINSALGFTYELYRVNNTDVESYVEWRKVLHSEVLPNGSDFKLEPAYNGAGLGMSGFTDTSLSDASYTYAGEFNWISHTWTHMNMDYLEDWQCNGQHKVCHPTAEMYDAELGYNKMVARGEGIASSEYIPLYYGLSPTLPHLFLDNRTDLMENNYSPHSLITPEITGLWPASYNATPPAGRKPYLKNELFFERLAANDIWNVVGDNSRKELNSANIYHGIISSVEEYGTAGVFIMPRWSPNIAFNCNSLRCVEQYYATGACNWITYGPPCPGLDVLSGHEIITREAKSSTIPLLQLLWDPYMFHQANFHINPYRNGTVPLISQFAQDSIEDTMRYVNGLPFVSVRMDELSSMYRSRMVRDNSNVYGEISFDAEGVPLGITVSGDNDFEAVLTITSASNLAFVDESVVVYGPDQNCFKNSTVEQPAFFRVTGTLI